MCSPFVGGVGLGEADIGTYLCSKTAPSAPGMPRPVTQGRTPWSFAGGLRRTSSDCSRGAGRATRPSSSPGRRRGRRRPWDRIPSSCGWRWTCACAISTCGTIGRTLGTTTEALKCRSWTCCTGRTPLAAGTCVVCRCRYEVLRLDSFCTCRSAGWGCEGPTCEITVNIASATGGSRDPDGNGEVDMDGARRGLRQTQRIEKVTTPRRNPGASV